MKKKKVRINFGNLFIVIFIFAFIVYGILFIIIENRNKNKEPTSQLESLIVALVNTEQYKYNYEETRNMSIYQFNSSLQQIIHKIGYDNRMHGVYAGTVDYKSLKPADLNWLSYN